MLGRQAWPQGTSKGWGVPGTTGQGYIPVERECGLAAQTAEPASKHEQGVAHVPGSAPERTEHGRQPEIRSGLWRDQTGTSRAFM